MFLIALKLYEHILSGGYNNSKINLTVAGRKVETSAQQGSARKEMSTTSGPMVYNPQSNMEKISNS